MTTFAHLVGAALLSLPFVAIFVIAVHQLGWAGAVGTFAACGALLGLILAGVWLMHV